MEIVKFENVEEKIITLRNLKVIIDSDVAMLYGVETKRVNEAVNNNTEKFPDGYIIELTDSEKKELVENFDHLDKLKYSSALPKAFTEKGLYMLATILKSSKATATTIAIIEAFAKVRELGRNIKEMTEMENENEKRSLMRRSGEIIAEIFDDDLAIDETETSIEINFAVLKLKHTIKKAKRI
jgi:hypothetical protein